MHRIFSPCLLAALLAITNLALPAGPGKEFLTEAEIEKVRNAQRIDLRIKVYLDAAELRLKTVDDRLTGKESTEGDPFEFFSPEDLMDGYNRILKSVMTNLDVAAQKKLPDAEKIQKALKLLRDGMKKSAKELVILKKMAEEKQMEKLWDLVNVAIETTDIALDGAVSALEEKEGKKNSESRIQNPE